MMVSLESETGCRKVHVNKSHLCHYYFSNFPPVRAFLGWGSLKQVLGSLRGDNKAEEGKKTGRHSESFFPNTPLHFSCHLVLEIKSNLGKSS